MLSMFSKRPDAEKPNDRSRLEVSLGRAENPGNVTPLKVPQAGFAEARQPRMAPQAQGRESQGRAKAFDNVPSVGQYLYHLNSDVRAFTRAETAHAVNSCTPIEVQRVARLLAKLKGRYIAQIVDLASGKRGPIGELDVADIRRAREMAEEVEMGLSALRLAIENGDLTLDGVKAE